MPLEINKAQICLFLKFLLHQIKVFGDNCKRKIYSKSKEFELYWQSRQ